MAQTADGVFESEAEHFRWVPISLMSTSGTLRLERGRLSFHTAWRKRVVFDEPVGDFHSLAPMTSLGMHIWLGRTRHRFSLGSLAYVPDSGANDLLDGAVAAASLPAARAHDAQNRALTSQWIELLGPLVGAPPSDVKIRKPWPLWAWWVGVVAATLVILGAITAGTLLFG